MNTNTNKHNGFSLVELMVVVVILGIIIGITLPMYQRYVENTRLTQARTVITQIQQDINTLKLRQGSLGADNTAVVATVQNVLDSNKSQNLINENNLDDFYAFNVAGGAQVGQYVFNVTPLAISEKGLYVDQSGNAFKCPDAASVSSQTGCEKM